MPMVVVVGIVKAKNSIVVTGMDSVVALEQKALIVEFVLPQLVGNRLPLILKTPFAVRNKAFVP